MKKVQELPFPLEIQLTESEKEFFSRRGPAPSAWNETRRHPRFYFRTCITARIFPPLESQDSPSELHHVLARDISRSGLSILHSQQLIPGQRVLLRLRDGSQCSTRVRWCHRLGERCYAAGCAFEQVEQADAMLATVPSESDARAT
jgi:hypothetical protein